MLPVLHLVLAHAAAPVASAHELAAPPSGHTPSSNWPWVVGLIVVIVLALAVLRLMLRRRSK